MISLIIAGVVAILLIIFIAISYVKCPPDMVYLISGIKKNPRIIVGKATLRIPFFERVDKLTLELIQIDIKTNNVPTSDFINVNVDAVANVRIPNNEELIRVAARHFLNQDSRYIAENVQQVLEGNMREIIGQMPLVDLVNNKQLFSQKIQENAQDDINNIGLEIVNLNVQSCTDDNDAIENLGIDNLVRIQKTAKIARANSEKEIKVAEAEADEQGNKARVEADEKIAEQNKNLALKKSEFKIEQDNKKAMADAAYEIQKAEQMKTVNENRVSAEIAKAEKMTELKEKEVALKERELDALVRKQADAEKYAAEIKAQADKAVIIQNAETPKIASTIGRDRNLKLRSDWEEVKQDVMFDAVYYKFKQNKDILQKLLDTGNATIVEATVKENYWGCGPNNDGQNNYGKILIKVREKLRTEQKKGDQ